MAKTQRTFKDMETGEIFDLHMDPFTHEYQLISGGSERFAKGTEVNGFHIACHTSMEIKLNTGRVVKLDRGEFYNLKVTGDDVIEEVTHVKYCGFKKFKKIA